MSAMARGAAPSLTPRALINRHSAGGQPLDINVMAVQPGWYDSCMAIASGALTAATLSTVVSVTGAGKLAYLRVMSADATARSIRCRVTLDGNVVFDSTSTAAASLYAAMQIIGATAPAANSASANLIGGLEFDQISFAVSMKIEICSNLTETAKLLTMLNYSTN